jgi:hypothetical protein
VRVACSVVRMAYCVWRIAYSVLREGRNFRTASHAGRGATGDETHQVPGTSEVPGTWWAIFRTVAHAAAGATTGEKLTPRRQDAEAVRRTQRSFAPFAPLREASRVIFRAEHAPRVAGTKKSCCASASAPCATALVRSRGKTICTHMQSSFCTRAPIATRVRFGHGERQALPGLSR